MSHVRWLVLICLFTVGAVCEAFAQSNPRYVQFSPSAVKGALYKPDAGPTPHTAVLLMHRTQNFMGALATTELSKRGFLVLGMNPSFDNNETSVIWEDIALDVKSGVEFLRKQPGITKVILFAHSGGGPTMSFYQAVTEKGSSYCQSPNKVVQCGTALANLPSADGLMFVDAHPGNSVNVLRSINAAVTNESDPRAIDPALDPLNPANGFNPTGPSKYPEEFKRRYFAAQSARMNRLIAAAQQSMARIKAGQGLYADDDAFLIGRGEGGRLMEYDLSIDRTTENPRKLLRNDGTVETRIVESVRPVGAAPSGKNLAFASARLFTLGSFLSTNAIRSTNSMTGIDWCSSNNSTPCALQQISVPVLITAMGGHYFIRDSEIHYELAASRDKDFLVGHRRRDTRSASLHRLRAHARAILERDDEFFRLPTALDERQILTTPRERS